MTDVTQEETKQLASAFRPNRRPRVIALFVNLTVAALLLGGPYFRGWQIATAERHHFVAFTRCLLGGEIAAAPGLSIPRGESEHFAAKVLLAGPDWPLSCRPLLRKVAPPGGFFLWPSIKRYGADVRAAVEMVDRELQRLAEHRRQGLGSVPRRPLDALKRLQAASVLYARAADIDRDIDNDALVLKPNVRRLATPSHLPLMAGDTTALQVWSRDGTIEAFAIDRRALSFLRVDHGKVEHERVRKNAFLRGAVRASKTPYLVWAMPDARCILDDGGCVGRPTGLAQFKKGSSPLANPTWKLSGHPAGRLDRVLEVSDTGRVDLVARSGTEGGLTLLRFNLPAPNEGAPSESKTLTLETFEEWPIVQAAGPTSASLVGGEPRAVARASDTADGVEASLTWAAVDRQPLQLARAAGHGAWLLQCGAANARWLAFGSTSELHLHRIDPERGATPLITQTIDLRATLDETDPAQDKLRLLCAGSRAQLLYVTAKQVLMQVSCLDHTCTPATRVTSGVAQFAALLSGDATIIAYHAGPYELTVKVLRLDAQGAPAGAPLIPAACWEPPRGMCGTPTLTGDARRILLLARDGPDLLALETVDQGRSFSSLSELPDTPSFKPSTASSLQRYRKRKWLE
jgi:hypothetical protein